MKVSSSVTFQRQSGESVLHKKRAKQEKARKPYMCIIQRDTRSSGMHLSQVEVQALWPSQEGVPNSFKMAS